MQLLFTIASRLDRLTRGVQNHFKHEIWGREHWRVVHLMRPNIGAHTISHEALSLRANHPVLFREEKPRWFRFPCGRGGFLLNALQCYRSLNRRHDRCFVLRNLMGYRVLEALFRHPDKTTFIGCKPRSVRMWMSAIEHVRDRSTFVGRQRCHVHERLYSVFMRCGDHSTAVRVPGQYYWPTRSFEHAFESGYVIRERCQGNRGTANRKPLSPQRQNNVAPSGSVSPCSVNQHDSTRWKSNGSHTDPPREA
jgi:hypothetical protein